MNTTTEYGDLIENQTTSTENGESNVPTLNDPQTPSNNVGETELSVLSQIDNCLKSADKLVSTIGDSVAKCKEIDKQMRGMELNFRQLSQEMDNDLEKYKARIPIVEAQMNKITEFLSKILDKVLEMDAKTDSEMNFKLRLMEQIDSFMNTISTTMMRLL
jgi:hypothetical protein